VTVRVRTPHEDSLMEPLLDSRQDELLDRRDWATSRHSSIGRPSPSSSKTRHTAADKAT
jgi:hypothetical protein